MMGKFFLCYLFDHKESGMLADGTKTTFSVGEKMRIALKAKTQGQAEKEARRCWEKIKKIRGITVFAPRLENEANDAVLILEAR